VNDLLLHPTVEQHLSNFMNTPSHALLLIGPSGSGKRAVATHLAEQILAITPERLENYPYKFLISPVDNKAIGIEVVRELEHFLSLKVPTQAPYNRVIIIENAHLLSTEAQNALLKTLEEPPAGSFIVLTTNNGLALLPTIRSRAQSIVIQRPESAAIKAYFAAQNHDTAAIQQAYAISGGLPGLMRALLDQTDHPLLLATQQARQLLSQSAYERLLLVDSLSRQRQLALDVTFILQQMAHISLQTAAGPAANKWQNVLSAAYHANEALTTNAQTKLVLTDLMLSL
jgi:replication-associated recombination protein RarA